MSTHGLNSEVQDAALAAAQAAYDDVVRRRESARQYAERLHEQRTTAAETFRVAARATDQRFQDQQGEIGEELIQLNSIIDPPAPAPQTAPAQPPAPPAQGGNTATLPGDIRWDDQRPQARPPAGNPPAPVPPATAPQPPVAGRNPVNPRNWGPLTKIAALVGAIVGLLVGLNWYPFAASGARRIVSEIFWTVGWVVVLGFLFGLIVDQIVQGYQEYRRNH